MKRILPILLIQMLVLFLLAGNVSSAPYGTDITVFDDRASGTNSWYTGATDSRIGIKENNEVETGMQTGQQWDMEGFFLEGNTLHMVGGYDLIAGEGGYDPGDIFFDIDGDVITADGSDTGTDSTNGTFGYDFAVRFSFDDTGFLSASLFEAGIEATTLGAYYDQNVTSNPWRMDQGWDVVPANIGSSYDPGIDNEFFDILFGDDNRNLLSIVLPDNFIFQHVHFTMECGNDNLMGRVNVPEPAGMLLLGTGLIGLAGLGRKKIFK